MNVPPLPTGFEPSSDSVRALRASSSGAIFGQLAATKRALSTYRPRLRARIAALQRIDAEANMEFQAELAMLRADRSAMLRDLDAWVMHDAGELARERGIASVSTTASPHATDLTSAVAALMARDEAIPTP